MSRNINFLTKKFENDVPNSNVKLPVKFSNLPVLQTSLPESISRDVKLTKETNDDNNLKKGDGPDSEHYAIFKRIHTLNLWYGYPLGLVINDSWKYNNFTRWTKFMLILGTVIAIYSHLLVITQPTKLIEVFSLFGMIIPTKPVGFIIANLIMMKMGVWAYAGSVGFDLYIARLIQNYLAMVKLLQQDLIEYVEMCKANDFSEYYKNAVFGNFLLKCQDKDRFIQFVNDTYADVIFKQFAVVYVCLTFTIYAIIRSNWYSGYGIMLFFLAQLYILCILGNSIQTENDKFCAGIYNIPWYDYPLPMQKQIQTLLHSSQNALELWIGPFAPLNVESAVEITKSIYSTSTMIINTSE